MKAQWEKDAEAEAKRFAEHHRPGFVEGARWMREYLRKEAARVGGEARAKVLTPEQRSEIAKKAAAAREAKKTQKK